jgi:hypothetical protein
LAAFSACCCCHALEASADLDKKLDSRVSVGFFELPREHHAQVVQIFDPVTKQTKLPVGLGMVAVWLVANFGLLGQVSKVVDDYALVR